MEVSDDKSMWDYLEGDFLDGIYNEIWYNDGDTQWVIISPTQYQINKQHNTFLFAISG